MEDNGLAFPKELNVVTGSAPSFTYFENTQSYYLAFKQCSGENRLLTMSSSDGTYWKDANNMEQTTTEDPSLHAFKGKLYCAFKSNDNSNHLLITSTSNGKDWCESYLTGQKTGSAPSLRVFGDKLYCAYKQCSGDNQLLIIYSDDGENWSDPVHTNQATPEAPSLLAFKGKLYCAFKSNDKSYSLLIISSSNGMDWSKFYSTGQKTGSAPCLAAREGILYCAYKQCSANNHLLITYSEDGENWINPNDTNQSSSKPPSFAFLNDGSMFLAFQANDPSYDLVTCNTAPLDAAAEKMTDAVGEPTKSEQPPRPITPEPKKPKREGFNRVKIKMTRSAFKTYIKILKEDNPNELDEIKQYERRLIAKGIFDEWYYDNEPYEYEEIPSLSEDADLLATGGMENAMRVVLADAEGVAVTTGVLAFMSAIVF